MLWSWRLNACIKYLGSCFNHYISPFPSSVSYLLLVPSLYQQQPDSSFSKYLFSMVLYLAYLSLLFCQWLIPATDIDLVPPFKSTDVDDVYGAQSCTQGSEMSVD